jgi:hypothetical protein
VSRRRLLALAVTLVVIGLAVVGAGWKWGCSPHAAGAPVRLAGWTWDDMTVQGGNGNGNGNGHP